MSHYQLHLNEILKLLAGFEFNLIIFDSENCCVDHSFLLRKLQLWRTHGLFRSSITMIPRACDTHADRLYSQSLHPRTFFSSAKALHVFHIHFQSATFSHYEEI